MVCHRTDKWVNEAGEEESFGTHLLLLKEAESLSWAAVHEPASVSDDYPEPEDRSNESSRNLLVGHVARSAE